MKETGSGDFSITLVKYVPGAKYVSYSKLQLSCINYLISSIKQH